MEGNNPSNSVIAQSLNKTHIFVVSLYIADYFKYKEIDFSIGQN
jgi:hypothetical protein